MNKNIFWCLLFLGICGVAYGGQISTIELSDGSVIHGEIVSLKDGVYTLQAGSLGNITVEASKVRNIYDPDKKSPLVSEEEISKRISGSNIEAIKQQMSSVQNAIVSNPETMKSVTELLSDPQFQEIIKDPEIVEAAKSQDIKSLISNKKFMNLLNHRAVKDIGSKLSEQNE